MLEHYFPDPITKRLRMALLPVLFVIFIGAMAAMLNSPYKNAFGLAIVTSLARFEIFHVLAHCVIFFSLVIMVWRVVRSPRYLPLAWGFVIAGTLAIEVTQIITRHQSLTAPVIGASVYDLCVNVLAAAAAMVILRVSFP